MADGKLDQDEIAQVEREKRELLQQAQAPFAELANELGNRPAAFEREKAKVAERFEHSFASQADQYVENITAHIDSQVDSKLERQSQQALDAQQRLQKLAKKTQDININRYAGTESRDDDERNFAAQQDAYEQHFFQIIDEKNTKITHTKEQLVEHYTQLQLEQARIHANTESNAEQQAARELAIAQQVQAHEQEQQHDLADDTKWVVQQHETIVEKNNNALGTISRSIEISNIHTANKQADIIEAQEQQERARQQQYQEQAHANITNKTQASVTLKDKSAENASDNILTTAKNIEVSRQQHLEAQAQIIENQEHKIQATISIYEESTQNNIESKYKNLLDNKDKLLESTLNNIIAHSKQSTLVLQEHSQQAISRNNKREAQYLEREQTLLQRLETAKEKQINALLQQQQEKSTLAVEFQQNKARKVAFQDLHREKEVVEDANYISPQDQYQLDKQAMVNVHAENELAARLAMTTRSLDTLHANVQNNLDNEALALKARNELSGRIDVAAKILEAEHAQQQVQLQDTTSAAYVQHKASLSENTYQNSRALAENFVNNKNNVDQESKAVIDQQEQLHRKKQDEQEHRHADTILNYALNAREGTEEFRVEQYENRLHLADNLEQEQQRHLKAELANQHQAEQQAALHQEASVSLQTQIREDSVAEKISHQAQLIESNTNHLQHTAQSIQENIINKAKRDIEANQYTEQQKADILSAYTNKQDKLADQTVEHKVQTLEQAVEDYQQAALLQIAGHIEADLLAAEKAAKVVAEHEAQQRLNQDYEQAQHQQTLDELEQLLVENRDIIASTMQDALLNSATAHEQLQHNQHKDLNAAVSQYDQQLKADQAEYENKQNQYQATDHQQIIDYNEEYLDDIYNLLTNSNQDLEQQIHDSAKQQTNLNQTHEQAYHNAQQRYENDRQNNFAKTQANTLDVQQSILEQNFSYKIEKIQRAEDLSVRSVKAQAQNFQSLESALQASQQQYQADLAIVEAQYLEILTKISEEDGQYEDSLAKRTGDELETVLRGYDHFRFFGRGLGNSVAKFFNKWIKPVGSYSTYKLRNVALRTQAWGARGITLINLQGQSVVNDTQHSLHQTTMPIQHKGLSLWNSVTSNLSAAKDSTVRFFSRGKTDISHTYANTKQQASVAFRQTTEDPKRTVNQKTTAVSSTTREFFARKKTAISKNVNTGVYEAGRAVENTTHYGKTGFLSTKTVVKQAANDTQGSIGSMANKTAQVAHQAGYQANLAARNVRAAVVPPTKATAAHADSQLKHLRDYFTSMPASIAQAGSVCKNAISQFWQETTRPMRLWFGKTTDSVQIKAETVVKEAALGVENLGNDLGNSILDNAQAAVVIVGDGLGKAGLHLSQGRLAAQEVLPNPDHLIQAAGLGVQPLFNSVTQGVQNISENVKASGTVLGSEMAASLGAAKVKVVAPMHALGVETQHLGRQAKDSVSTLIDNGIVLPFNEITDTVSTNLQANQTHIKKEINSGINTLNTNIGYAAAAAKIGASRIYQEQTQAITTTTDDIILALDHNQQALRAGAAALGSDALNAVGNVTHQLSTNMANSIDSLAPAVEYNQSLVKNNGVYYGAVMAESSVAGLEVITDLVQAPIMAGAELVSQASATISAQTQQGVASLTGNIAGQYYGAAQVGATVAASVSAGSDSVGAMIKDTSKQLGSAASHAGIDIDTFGNKLSQNIHYQGNQLGQTAVNAGKDLGTYVNSGLSATSADVVGFVQTTTNGVDETLDEHSAATKRAFHAGTQHADNQISDILISAYSLMNSAANITQDTQQGIKNNVVYGGQKLGNQAVHTLNTQVNLPVQHQYESAQVVITDAAVPVVAQWEAVKRKGNDLAFSAAQTANDVGIVVADTLDENAAAAVRTAKDAGYSTSKHTQSLTSTAKTALYNGAAVVSKNSENIADSVITGFYGAGVGIEDISYATSAVTGGAGLSIASSIQETASGMTNVVSNNTAVIGDNISAVAIDVQHQVTGASYTAGLSSMIGLNSALDAASQMLTNVGYYFNRLTTAASTSYTQAGYYLDPNHRLYNAQKRRGDLTQPLLTGDDKKYKN